MSDERKSSCGCYVCSIFSSAGTRWVVMASAFLCPYKHRQGDYADAPEPSSSGDGATKGDDTA